MEVSHNRVHLKCTFMLLNKNVYGIRICKEENFRGTTKRKQTKNEENTVQYMLILNGIKKSEKQQQQQQKRPDFQ